nr:MAG TPA: major capsid protein [Caudoviricetes sp.]
MAHVIYSNFYLSNEVEDQYNSHINLQNFCSVDNSLTDTAGMIRKINVYNATSGTEKLKMGEGNKKSIEVKFVQKDYTIELAQNKFDYYDEQAMTDPMLVPVGTRHMGTDIFNTVNKDIYTELLKAPQVVVTDKLNFAAFADAVASLNIESTDNAPGDVAPRTFAFINAADTAELRKTLAEDLKYVESFARTGYVGTVAGVNIYTKKDAKAGTIVVATREAVTIFNKKGIEIEQDRDGDTRHNFIYSRKYYLVALTDTTKAVRIVKGKATATADTTITADKVYYAKTDSGYIVGSPETNPNAEGFYEIA